MLEAHAPADPFVEGLPSLPDRMVAWAAWTGSDDRIRQETEHAESRTTLFQVAKPNEKRAWAGSLATRPSVVEAEEVVALH